MKQKVRDSQKKGDSLLSSERKSETVPFFRDSMRPRILMVDDDEILLEFYAEALSGEYEVLTAGDIGTALLLLQGQQVAAVACDLHFEGVNGLDLLAWMQAHQPELLRRTMILSGDPSARPGGFNVRVIGKPVDADGLKQAFEMLLKQDSGDAS